MCNDNPMVELELAEALLNGLDPDRRGSFYAYVKSKQSEACDADAAEAEARAFELNRSAPNTIQKTFDRCAKWKSDPAATEARPSAYSIDDSLAATAGGNKTKPIKRSPPKTHKIYHDSSGATCCAAAVV